MSVADRLIERKVLLVVQNLPVPFDRRVWQEALALRDAGAEVTVICPADDKHAEGAFEIDGIRVVRFPPVVEGNSPIGYVREYWQSIRDIRRAVKRERTRTRFDVIHICNPPDMLFLAVVSLRRRDRLPIIFDQHDLGPELVRAKKMPLSWVFVTIATVLERMTYAVAKHVIATNESYRHVAMTRGRKAAHEVTVVRSGPRRAWIETEPQTDRWHEGRRYLIGYVGVMGPQEGIDYLLEAIGILATRGRDVQAALVGSGPDIDRLKELAVTLGVADRVTFHGRLSDTDLRSVLQNSDVCVNPDEVNELNNLSTMNKIVEYMALGKPIVQFDVLEGRYSAGEASRYASANSSASFADEIDTVLTDRGLAEAMGAFGVERFSGDLCWEAQIPPLVAAYETTIGK